LGVSVKLCIEDASVTKVTRLSTSKTATFSNTPILEQKTNTRSTNLPSLKSTAMANSSLEPLPDSNNRWFALNVSKSESDCLNYLRYFGIFTKPPFCAGRKGKACNSIMVESIHRGKLKWTCPVSSCATYKSIATGNDFFIRMNEKGSQRQQLGLHDIAEIVWHWCYSRMILNQAAVAVGVWKQYICTWYSCCRLVCTATESALPKLVGTTAQHIQVDESYFAERRKYNCGKCRVGDILMPGECEARRELEVEVLEVGSVDPGIDNSDEGDGLPTRPSSYENRIIGPWVVGVYKNSQEFRFFVVPDRKSGALRALLKRCCAEGSVIRTDEWKVYCRLNEGCFSPSNCQSFTLVCESSNRRTYTMY